MKKSGLGVVTFIVVTSLIVVAPIRSSQERPSIEVASLKPNNSGARSSSTDTNRGSLRATNVTLRSLILIAYNLSAFQLDGGPDWVKNATFDIQAKSDAPPDSKPNPRGLIQALVEDRFHLRAHRETREQPVFFLTVAKGGSKLQQAVEGTSGQNRSAPSTSTYGTPVSEEIKASAASIDELIKLLSVRVERPIIDRTNFTGSFDFTLKFART